MSKLGKATARACANIALVKYWGKRDPVLNLPAAGSLSMTLDALVTETSVEFDDDLNADVLILDGATADAKATARTARWLDLVRERASVTAKARVVSGNNFPTASGLASSASAYAALALAATRAASYAADPAELSELARLGSGSAARSIFGGFVEMAPGVSSDGKDAVARPIDDGGDWDVRMVVAVVGGGVKKSVSSRDAMTHCAETSPLYQAWVGSVPGDIEAAREAIARRDLGALGAIAEGSALAMHAAALASRPTIRYFRPETLAVMARVESLREAGAPAFYTMDAGPHVKILTAGDAADDVARAVRDVPGVSDVLHSRIGGPAVLLDDGSAGAARP